jgi:hypothetical protein
LVLQVSKGCDFCPPILKIALYVPQVSVPLQNLDPLNFDSVKADMSRFFLLAMLDIIKIKILPTLIITIKIKIKIIKGEIT